MGEPWLNCSERPDLHVLIYVLRHIIPSLFKKICPQIWNIKTKRIISRGIIIRALLTLSLVRFLNGRRSLLVCLMTTIGVKIGYNEINVRKLPETVFYSIK